MTQNIGEGHFVDDSGEDDSEEEDGPDPKAAREEGKHRKGSAADHGLGQADEDDDGLHKYLDNPGNIRRKANKDGVGENAEDGGEEDNLADHWLAINEESDKEREAKELKRIQQESEALRQKEEEEER